MSSSWKFCGEQRAHVLEAVDRPLVQRHQVLAVRADRVALGRGQVTDVVLHRGLGDQRPGLLAILAVVAAQGPARHGAVQEQAGVGVALVVELGVQRAQAHLDLGLDHGVEVQDRHAVVVGVPVGPAAIASWIFCEAVDGDVRVELAGDDDVVAVGRHVDAVRALGLGHEVQHALGGRHVQRDHPEAVDLRRLPAARPARRPSRG